MAEKQDPTVKAQRAAVRSLGSGQGFASKVVADPNAVPAVYVVAGYPGDSGGEGQTRLYLSPDLSTWIDLPEDAVVHVQDIPSDNNWLGAVLVWVKQDAKVNPGSRWSQPQQQTA